MKIIKKIVKTAQQLIGKAFEVHTAVFGTPKQVSLPLDWDDLSGKQRKVVKAFARRCRKQSSGAKKCKAKRFSLSDRGDTVLDFMVVPMPKVSVLTDDGIVRYVGVLFIWRDHLLLSLQQVQAGTLAGINLSNKERKLLQRFLNLTGQRIWRHSITIDRRSNARINLMQATAWLSAPPADRLASAINALPLSHLFGALHAVLATLMPLLDEDCKPCYLPQLRLSEDETVREMQLEALRLSLGGLAFARDRSGCGPLLPELALQDRDAIRTLEQVHGLPVLAQVDRDPVQRALTDAMQCANCELIATGFAKHPLRTVPLLTGTMLPADNVILALDWPTFTAADPDDFAALRRRSARCCATRKAWPTGCTMRPRHGAGRTTLRGDLLAHGRRRIRRTAVRGYRPSRYADAARGRDDRPPPRPAGRAAVPLRPRAVLPAGSARRPGRCRRGRQYAARARRSRLPLRAQGRQAVRRLRAGRGLPRPAEETRPARRRQCSLPRVPAATWRDERDEP